MISSSLARSIMYLTLAIKFVNIFSTGLPLARTLSEMGVGLGVDFLTISRRSCETARDTTKLTDNQ